MAEISLRIFSYFTINFIRFLIKIIMFLFFTSFVHNIGPFEKFYNVRGKINNGGSSGACLELSLTFNDVPRQ